MQEQRTMPKLTSRLTDKMATKVPPPASGYEIHWCPATPGFGLRVSSTGDRAYILERRVDGKTTRRTLGKAAGPGAISAEAAREIKIETSSLLQKRQDPLAAKREARKTQVRESVTLSAALEEYVEGKVRSDGLGLSLRTKADYLELIRSNALGRDGKPLTDGPLAPIAGKSIHKITAGDMRDVYERTHRHSKRQAVYAMQVLRAVLNWHGVQVQDSPLAKTTPGRYRIVLPPTKGKPRPITPERLGAWWRAASSRTGVAGADALRFLLLTGCRPGEVIGNETKGGLRVRDVDLVGGRATVEPKRRVQHTILLSRQALQILEAACKGKKPSDKVFAISTPRTTLGNINKEAGVTGISPQKLRQTFVSVADELLPTSTRKLLVNHSTKDIAEEHYIGKSEAQLRAAWQKVADFIEECSLATK
jgi:integrase